MSNIIFILGGARSGKSSYAVKIAEKMGKNVAFIATCSSLRDKEMKKRIEIHKKSRPSHWQTFEEPKDIVAVLQGLKARTDVVVIDCLTFLISNLLLDGLTDNVIENRIKKMLEMLKTQRFKSIIISNEVGIGIVPRNHLARRFRDLAGRVNQIVAQEANKVFFMISGLPLKVKGAKK